LGKKPHPGFGSRLRREKGGTGHRVSWSGRKNGLSQKVGGRRKEKEKGRKWRKWKKIKMRKVKGRKNKFKFSKLYKLCGEK
jgi:hypothetical protein